MVIFMKFNISSAHNNSIPQQTTLPNAASVGRPFIKIGTTTIIPKMSRLAVNTFKCLKQTPAACSSVKKSVFNFCETTSSTVNSAFSGRKAETSQSHTDANPVPNGSYTDANPVNNSGDETYYSKQRGFLAHLIPSPPS